MNYNDFKKAVMKFQQDHHGDKTFEGKDILFCTYNTGGVQGGSCWKSSNPQAYTNLKPMDEFEEFYSVLEKFTPNISFLQVKKMEKELVKNVSNTEREWYGNCEDFYIRYVDVKEMYDYMVKNNLISE